MLLGRVTKSEALYTTFQRGRLLHSVKLLLGRETRSHRKREDALSSYEKYCRRHFAAKQPRDPIPLSQRIVYFPREHGRHSIGDQQHGVDLQRRYPGHRIWKLSYGKWQILRLHSQDPGFPGIFLSASWRHAINQTCEQGRRASLIVMALWMTVAKRCKNLFSRPER
jgi:hypothetical protein